MIWPSTRDLTATEATVSTLPIACRRSGIDFSTTFPISTGTVGTAFLASAWAPPLLSEQAPNIQAASSAGTATARILVGFEAGRKTGRIVTLIFPFTASATPVQSGTRLVANQLLILRSFVCAVYGSRACRNLIAPARHLYLESRRSAPVRPAAAAPMHPNPRPTP